MEYILPVLIAILGSFAVQRYVAFRNASRTFRAAVLAELGSIYPNISAWPNNIDAYLRSKFESLQIAVANFRPFVPRYRRKRFDLAWFRYRCATGRQIDTQCYLHYFDSYDPLTSTQAEATANVKALFLANVEQLLSYAKET